LAAIAPTIVVAYLEKSIIFFCVGEQYMQ